MLFQYLITVCDDADKNCPTNWSGVSIQLYWHFEDPVTFMGMQQEKLVKFRQLRDQIEQKVKTGWLNRKENGKKT